MSNFYKGELEISNSDKILNIYVEAKDDNDAENKIFQYYDNNLTRVYGELQSISIIKISVSEYYKIYYIDNKLKFKKNDNIFI